MRKHRFWLSFFLLFFSISLLTSCYNYKNIAYFEDVSDSVHNIVLKTVEFKNPVIKPDDVLSINIQTLDQDITSFLNSTTGSAAMGTSQLSVNAQQFPNGYLVDRNGEVEVPIAGRMKLQGLTTAEARDSIQRQVNRYFNQAVVSVRFANFKITLIGEVAKPASYIVPNEKINIFDGLGLAGDLTIFGRRENVVLLRDSADEKKLVRLNLNSKEIVSSPYFFLKPNDIIYVEPNKYKVASVDAVRNRNITIIAAALSFVTILFSRVIRP